MLSKKGFPALSFVILFFMTGTLGAQDLPSVAVVSLDIPVSRSAEESVLKTLGDADLKVISPEELQRRLSAVKSPTPSSEVAGKFAKMSALLSKGIEKFFYENETKAITLLLPIFDLGMKHIEVLARRPDYADQIFQAGILLIRAYESQGKKRQAEEIVSAIVYTFPTQSFKSSVIPPDVGKRLQIARRAMGDNTTLTLTNRGENSSSCVPYVNGFSATLNQKISVKADSNYHLRLDCGGEKPVVWQTQISKGKHVELPLTPNNPTAIGISSNELSARQEAETSLMAIMFWAKIDHIVGVSEHYRDDGDVLVVRIQNGSAPRWSDGASKEDMTKALVRVFPELDIEEDRGNIYGEAKSSSTEWFGWTMVVLGLGAAGGGTYFYLDAKKALDETPGDDKAKNAAKDQKQYIAFGLWGTGALLFTYGVYRIATHEDPAESSFLVGPALSQDSVGLQLHTQF